MVNEQSNFTSIIFAWNNHNFIGNILNSKLWLRIRISFCSHSSKFSLFSLRQLLLIILNFFLSCRAWFFLIVLHANVALLIPERPIVWVFRIVPFLRLFRLRVLLTRDNKRNFRLQLFNCLVMRFDLFIFSSDLFSKLGCVFSCFVRHRLLLLILHEVDARDSRENFEDRVITNN